MSEYTPDYWVLVEIESEYGKVQKIFATWAGGYLDSSCWKMSSGIKTFVDKGDHYESLQCSGSVYRLGKKLTGIHWSWQSLYDNFKKQVEEIGGKFTQIQVSEVHCE